MKIIAGLLIAGGLLLTGVNNVNGQAIDPARAMKMLKECYTAYNYTWATKKGTILQKKLDSLEQKYCTPQLISKLKRMGPDYDLLAFNAYTDVQHLKTLTVTKDADQEDAYLISYINHSITDSKPVDQKIIIHVNVLEQPDGLKISSVK